MGLIRTLLALCVAAFHSYKIAGLGFTGGKVSVQCFYIISGFYMALILNEKYVGENYSYGSFVKGRFLRLYPAYLVVMLLSFIISAAGLYFWNNPYYLGLYIPHWQNLGTAARFWFIIENFLLIGQDALFFFKVKLTDGSLHFTPYAFVEKNRLILNGFLFVPQAWSLSIEICFYLLAPFIVRTNVYIKLCIIALSLLARYYFYSGLHLNYDPWTYRFFPFELAFFTAGTLLYPIYQKLNHIKFSNVIGFWGMLILLLLIIFYDKIPIAEYKRCWYFYIIFSLLTPFVFCYSKSNRFDRWIGELSFPVYLIHHLIMFLLRQYFWSNTGQMEWFGVFTVLLSLLAAILFYFSVISPIEKYRQKLLILEK